MTMSDELFETIEEMNTWKRMHPEWYSGKEFNKKYNATVKVMRSFARYMIAPEKKSESVWKREMKGFKWK